MAGNAFIMTGYSNEADTTPDSVMGIDGTWIDLTTAADAAARAVLMNGAAAYADGAYAIEEVRTIQGQFQSRYTDRDVRMERVNATITYPAV